MPFYKTHCREFREKNRFQKYQKSFLWLQYEIFKKLMMPKFSFWLSNLIPLVIFIIQNQNCGLFKCLIIKKDESNCFFVVFDR